MNIPDTGNTPETSRANPAYGNTNRDQAERIQDKEPEKNVPAGQRQDEYVQLTAPVQRSALYDVSDVRRGRISSLKKQIMEKQYTPSGEVIAEKIVDVILPPGIKNLRIFRKE
ncbi:flagellar biosynthesis anti-sigma factor FlgM [bacterium]|nr:flagellar biosynthesis anti-sigma factor FlgM [bacterium]